MKIKYKKGNLIHAQEKFILHGCNAQGRMGSGVAKAIRDRWPEVFKPYKEYCDSDSTHRGANILGTILPVDCEDKVVLNAISQQFYGYTGDKFVSYDAVHNIMRELNYRLPANTAVAMPRIGSTLGGGSWPIVSIIIEDTLDTIQPIVYDLV